MDAATMAKWTNLVVVVGAGIYALSLLVTVDMDNWRGWTLQEIMLRIPCECLFPPHSARSVLLLVITR